jgi:hypothetical protein
MCRFQVSRALTMNNAVPWDVMTCGSCKNRRFGGTYRFLNQCEKNQRARNFTSIKQLKHTAIYSVLRFVVNANVVHSSLILFTLMMEAPCSSKLSVLIGATRRQIPEDGILHNHRNENLKSDIALTGWTL